MAKPETNQGGRIERNAVRDRFRRKLKELRGNQSLRALIERKVYRRELRWMLGRPPRYRAKAGGL